MIILDKIYLGSTIGVKMWNRLPVFTLWLVCVVQAHIPIQLEDWPETGISVNVVENAGTKEAALDRLTALRDVMNQNGVDAYIIPTSDAHGSEYIAPSDARREWISGFTGSAGTAVVTSDQALVWTDARYYLQFEMEINTTLWQLMKSGDTSIPNWLLQNLEDASTVGVDPTTYTRSEWNSLQTVLTDAGMTLQAIDSNLVDLARDMYGESAPPRPNNKLIALGLEYTGKRASEKIAELITQMNNRGVFALVLSALDDIAYTLNLRGSDIPYNPVFFSYLVIRTDVSPSRVVLFWGSGTLTVDVVQHLTTEGVTVDAKPYNQIFTYLQEISASNEGSTIWLSNSGSHALYSAVEGNAKILSTVSPVALMKCVKNDVELKGFRTAHIKDGVAVVRFLHWIHQEVDAGNNVTEVMASDKLVEFRSEEEDFMGPSFSTIAGTGPNGAIIHYSPSREGEQFVVMRDHMLLVDSGGQYKDGTTDITRTRHMSSSPTPEQRMTFTRVLKGQISLATVVFPTGIMGNVLEILARKSLWDVGLNYGHGTGHGVGHFLNVHEGPSGIMSAPMAHDPGVRVHMIYSNEPGYYEEGEYGIRHEDLVEVIAINKDSDHIQASSLVGDFAGVGALGFNTISLAPHQTACLDIDLLTDLEIKYINNYHSRVLTTLAPALLEKNLTDVHDWLKKECAPIGRNAAILVYLSPVLAVFSVTISIIFK